MGRTAHAAVQPKADHRGMKDQDSIHRIEDDLSEGWVENLASSGIEAIETYLAKHLAFQMYLDEASAA